MKRKQFKKVKEKMINVGIELNKLESLSRILINSINNDSTLKAWDIANLSLVISKKILETKLKFNNIEVIIPLKNIDAVLYNPVQGIFVYTLGGEQFKIWGSLKEYNEIKKTLDEWHNCHRIVTIKK